MNRGAISVSSDSRLKELESGLCGIVYWTIDMWLPGRPSPDTRGRLGYKMSEAAQRLQIQTLGFVPVSNPDEPAPIPTACQLGPGLGLMGPPPAMVVPCISQIEAWPLVF
jgi:hypothetical protein